MNDAELIVHLVDDDAAVRDSLTMLIESEGYTVRAHADAEAFLAALIPGSRGCAVIDLRMPGMDGMTVLREIKRNWPDSEVIVVTGYAALDTAKASVLEGAFDYLPKPVGPDEVLHAASGALQHKRWALRREACAPVLH